MQRHRQSRAARASTSRRAAAASMPSIALGLDDPFQRSPLSQPCSLAAVAHCDPARQIYRRSPRLTHCALTGTRTPREDRSRSCLSARHGGRPRGGMRPSFHRRRGIHRRCARRSLIVALAAPDAATRARQQPVAGECGVPSALPVAPRRTAHRDGSSGGRRHHRALLRRTFPRSSMDAAPTCPGIIPPRRTAADACNYEASCSGWAGCTDVVRVDAVDRCAHGLAYFTSMLD